MSVSLTVTEVDATTINYHDGTLRVRGQVRNDSDRPVPVLLSQVVYQLDDHDGRPVPLTVDGLDQFSERTIRPDERVGFSMTLRAGRIKLGHAYRLASSLPGITGRDTVAFRFRLV